MQRKQPESLEAEKATVYALGGFGYRRMEARTVKVWLAPYAGHPSAVHFSFIEKGKRKAVRHVQDYRPSLLVLAGYDHPEPRSAMTDQRSEPIRDREGRAVGSVVTSITRWSCYAPEWAHEFFKVIDPYLAERPGVLLADYRGYDTTAGERVREIRAQGGVGPFTEGDRVVTPHGAGVVVYRRMRPPEFRDVDVYSVRRDGCDHVGAIYQAEQVRWEGAEA